MGIHWNDFGAVLVAALGTTMIVVLLFALGIAAWSRASDTPASGRSASGLRGRAAAAIAVLCFAACLAVAGYAIEVVVPG